MNFFLLLIKSLTYYLSIIEKKYIIYSYTSIIGSEKKISSYTMFLVMMAQHIAAVQSVLYNITISFSKFFRILGSNWITS